MTCKEYIKPVKVLAAERAVGTEVLLCADVQMASFDCEKPCVIAPEGWVLLDFGREYNGGVRIVAQDMQGKKNAKIRIRFGESAMECMADIGYKDATNDHSVRDEQLLLPWVGILEYGHTGYRFIRIDNKDSVNISVMGINGVYEHSGKAIKGNFRCNDELINQIWDVGVRTVYLNNNQLITDGIKRDRLVWIGDMHPESSAILRIFGYDKSICNSLDYIKNITPPDKWMNGIASYTMWWIKIHYDLYCYTGDREYLAAQLPYLREAIATLAKVIRDDGSCDIDFKFIDWPSSGDAIASDCGVYAMMSVAMKSAFAIFTLFGECDNADFCKRALAKLHRFKPSHNGNKQMGALLAFAGEADNDVINRTLLSENPLAGISTFLCYYVLMARAKAGDMNGTLDLIRKYYGAMLDLGATTFWEDFNYDWSKGAKPLDALLNRDEYDVHGDNGICCYIGYRHSLCHGWSAGVVPFLSEYVLGVKIVSEKPNEVNIKPDLGDLEWAEGDVPLANGSIHIRAEKNNGKTTVKYTVSDGIKANILL